jgi:Flp pilus assembly protein TadD
VLARLGEDAQAYDVLQHARQLNPQDSSTADFLYFTTLKLAEKDEKARQYSNALRYYNEAAKLRPQDPEPHRNLAEIYAKTGKPEQAAQEKQEADRLSNH